MTNWKVSTKKLTQIKQNIYLLKMNWKNYKEGTPNYLVFQPMHRYFKRVVNSDYILQCKSKGLSDESIKSPSAPHNFPNLSLNYLDTKIRAN